MPIINGDFGELRIDVDMIEVSSNLPKPDPNWRYTDRQGHEHRWDAGGNPYPTLMFVDDDTHWCEDCGEEHTDSHLECQICHETIAPGLVGPSGLREFMPGRTDYRLNGERISKERAQQLLGKTE